jgi:peptide/nickel transport system permease protein
LTLGWFPILGRIHRDGGGPILDAGLYRGDVIDHAILPAFTIVITSIGGWILTMRNNMITVVAEDYVKMGRAKGLKPRRILWQYAGRNAHVAEPDRICDVAGLRHLRRDTWSSTCLTIPALGFMLLQAVENEDFPLMQALFLLITVAVLVAIFVSDIATSLLDPRTRTTS